MRIFIRVVLDRPEPAGFRRAGDGVNLKPLTPLEKVEVRFVFILSIRFRKEDVITFCAVKENTPMV